MITRLPPCFAAMHRFLNLCFVSVVFTTQALGQIEIDAGGVFEVCTDSLFDSGGALNGYGSNESHVVTLCSEDSTSVLWIEWVLFSLDESSSLVVYDGDSEEATVLALGTLSQFEGSFFYPTSSNTSGCLTISFQSGEDASGDFQALVRCADPCLEPALENEILCLDDPDMVASVSFNPLGIDPPWVTYEWHYNGNDLPEEEANTLFAAAPGAYCVTINSSICEADFDASECAFVDFVYPLPELTTSSFNGNLFDFSPYHSYSVVWMDGQTYSLEEFIYFEAYSQDTLIFTVQDPYGCFDAVSYHWPDWLAVDESASDAIMAFPNPCEGILRLSSHDGLERINIFTLDGQLATSINHPGASIEIGWLPPGHYVLSIVPKTGLPTSHPIILK